MSFDTIALTVTALVVAGVVIFRVRAMFKSAGSGTCGSCSKCGSDGEQRSSQP